VTDKPPAPDQPVLLSAKEAAERLNISLATLYTYVSRKKLRAVRASGRSSRYFRADVERLLAASDQQGARAAVPVSAIAQHMPDDLLYRGLSAIDLSQHATLEDIARLLWGGEDVPFGPPTLLAPGHWQALLSATAALPPLDRVTMLLPVIENADMRAHDLSPGGFRRSGATILRWGAAIALGLAAPPEGPLHVWLAAALPQGAGHEDLLRRVLVLSAENGLEAPVRAVRATAATGATPYRCIVAGLAAATGSRLPSARMRSFGRFMQEIETGADPCEPILSRIREREAVPGFSYTPAVFGDNDPRAIELYRVMCEALADNAQFRRLRQAFDVAIDITGHQPEFSFLCACVGRLAGAEAGLSLVRIARLSGWIAHALEEYGRHEV
jgi:citrate synthase